MSLSPDDASLLAMSGSRMSTASIAACMGAPWTEAKVYNRLAKLKAVGVVRDEAAPLSAPKPDPKPAAVKRVAPSAPRAVQPAPGRVELIEAGGCAPPIVMNLPPPPIAEKAPPRASGPSPYDTSRPRPAPVALTPKPRRTPTRDRYREARTVERLRPLTPAVRRYAGWFLAAGWSVDDAAWLFDVSPLALEEACA
jgi:hypothetical protein